MGRSRALCGSGLVAVIGVLACLASTALAADKIYWTADNDGRGLIRVANLNGTGASTLFSGESDPQGIALDPATGKIYWADDGSGVIRVANLNGTGASNLFTGEDSPLGLTIDPASGKLYWSDDGSGTIRVGKLNGTGAANLFTNQLGATGVAIDHATGKIYWAATETGQISVGNLNGTGATALFSSETSPFGLAIDPAAGKIYWGSFYGAAVRVGSLEGGSASNLFSEQPSAQGVAIDPPARKIYWTLQTAPGKIVVGNLDGTDASDLLEGQAHPAYLALLVRPVGTGAPTVTGGSTVGSRLTCSRGSWASDVTGASLYRAPRTFARLWRLNGAPISGATSSTYKPTKPGSYRCQVTATNQAGSTSETSAAHTIRPRH